MMPQNVQNSSYKIQDIRRFAPTMSEQEAQRAYQRSLQELAALKKGYDPTNLFHLNQNILPARTGLLAA